MRASCHGPAASPMVAAAVARRASVRRSCGTSSARPAQMAITNNGERKVISDFAQMMQHGQAIARAIQSQSDNVLIVDHGSLYPALQRLEERGFIDADWGTSDNNRKARFYTLTKAGRKELVREESEWRRIAAAIMRVLDPSVGG